VPRWFRRKAGAEEQAPAEAAAPETQQADPGEPEEEGSEEKPKTRRRGTRGGRGGTETKRVAAKATAEAEEKPKPARRRRAATPKRSELPAVKKEMLISFDVGEERVAVLEDSTPVEVYLERPGRRSIAGNIYKGVVDNVLPGMEASFVDIGLEKNGFLYVDEILVPELEGKRHGRRIQDLISRGEHVLVQAVKDPMGTKGARLTTDISLPGRFLVLGPYGDGIGVSRRLEDDERERLKAICKELELPEGGVIVRTAAEGASAEELAGDLAFLRKLWSTIQGRATRAQAPALVYREAELPLRVVRDLFRSDFERLAVDHERTYRRIASYLKRTSPELAARVEWYREPDPLMERCGVDAAVRSTLDRRVDLPSGGYLIFDYAEAFTVIDVNTGRFVGSRGKSSTGRLEDTITKNNLEAAKEIVRQLRLRDIGGIIVIDFIDMANPKNRNEVEEALKRELERDRTKTYVVEISPLGLVEMTRQNVTDGPREILTERCPVCAGDGIVLSEETYAVEAERRLRRLAASSSSEAFLVELPAQVAGLLIGAAGARLSEIEQETGRRFAFEAKEGVPLDHFSVLAEGSAAKIEPQALPVRPGDELELELEEVHLHHPEDAIGRLDGYVVSVADAGSRIGETVRIRVERATRTVAYATVAGVDGAEAPVEPGAVAEEAEAGDEKPKTRRGTRGGRGRKKADVGAGPVRPDEARPDEAKDDEVKDDEPAAEEEKPKKKTRRGTRGGRSRKKPATQSPEQPAEAEPAPPEPAAEEEKPKKKTRRGTRGGRGRKKAQPAAEPVAAGTGSG
jgi:ribonuclease G